LAGDDTVELLLMTAEEGLNDYFVADPDWRSEPVRRSGSIQLYHEIVSALRAGLHHAGNPDCWQLVAQATAVAEGFRVILNRVLRVHLACQPITFPKPP